MGEIPSAIEARKIDKANYHTFLLLIQRHGIKWSIHAKELLMSSLFYRRVAYSPYCAGLRVEAETMEDLKDAVTRKIRTTDQVLSSLTMKIVE